MNGSENYSFSPDYAEYITKPSSGGKYAATKALIIAGAALLIIAAFVVMGKVPQVGFFALPVIFGVALLAWYLWRFTKAEYEYYIAQGELNFDVIYGERVRRALYSCKVRNFTSVCRAKDAGAATGRVISAVSSPDSENALCAVVKSESGEAVTLFFEADEKIIKIMKSFNPSVFYNFK